MVVTMQVVQQAKRGQSSVIDLTTTSCEFPILKKSQNQICIHVKQTPKLCCYGIFKLSAYRHNLVRRDVDLIQSKSTIIHCVNNIMLISKSKS